MLPAGGFASGAMARSARSFVSRASAWSAAAQASDRPSLRALGRSLIESLRLLIARFSRRRASVWTRAVAAPSTMEHVRSLRIVIDSGSGSPAHAAGVDRSHVHVTAARPDRASDTQP